eukprot:Skav208322  [mRNA]  locus=scaffold897:718781:725991:+ [translate_table: standard]
MISQSSPNPICTARIPQAIPSRISQAQLGLRRIVLTNAWRVEKSYFSSHSTEPKRYTSELLEGLEQAPPTMLAVGPEGGWVDYEVQMFKDHGFTQVALLSRASSGQPAQVKALADLKKTTCRDFASYADAKEPSAWFDKYFPQYGDIAGLDGDKDGKPCEKLLKK